jgi:hypothetical protein
MEKIDFQNDILILESQKYEIQLVHIRNELNKKLEILNKISNSCPDLDIITLKG